MAAVGQELYMDFNRFGDDLDAAIKAKNIKLTSSGKNQILNAVSWRDDKAERVIKKVQKLNAKKLDALLDKLDCTQEQLHDYGCWPGGSANEYIEYETDTDLRDTENVPLKEDIHKYFQREVRPHVDEAWINIDQTKIGYEISFNKYFYQHKPLRSLEEVTADILKLEAETEGLLKKLVSFGKLE